MYTKLKRDFTWMHELETTYIAIIQGISCYYSLHGYEETTKCKDLLAKVSFYFLSSCDIEANV